MSKGLNTEALQDLKALFDESKKVADPNAGLPDGDYIVEVGSVSIGMSSTDKLMAKWDLIVAEGEEFEGRHYFKNQVLDTPEKMKRFTIDVNNLSEDDVEDLDLEGLLEVLPELTGEYCLLNLKTSKSGSQWSNIHTLGDEDDYE